MDKSILIKKLEDLKYTLENVYYRKGNDLAYKSLIDVLTQLRIINKDSTIVKIGDKIIDSYNFNGTDLSKKEIIDEFKREVKSELNILLFHLKA